MLEDFSLPFLLAESTLYCVLYNVSSLIKEFYFKISLEHKQQLNLK